MAERDIAACVIERLLVIMDACAGRPSGDYANAVEAAVADPAEREGLPESALTAISYIEGIADSWDCTALDLLDALEITVDVLAAAKRLRALKK